MRVESQLELDREVTEASLSVRNNEAKSFSVIEPDSLVARVNNDLLSCRA